MRFENVSVLRKSYCGERLVLEGVSYEAQERGLDIIYAPPGAGKTTFLETAAGLIKPDAGSVKCSGEVHFLMQVPERGFTGLTCREEGGGDLSAVGLPDDVAELSPWLLSRGERKKLALAGILNYNDINDNKFLLMDDPFTDLDAKGAETVAGVISSGKYGVLLATNRASDLSFFQRRKIMFRLFGLKGGKLRICSE